MTPTLTFDADQYLAVVRDAMEDRGWETRPRAVIRQCIEPRTIASEGLWKRLR
jgi:hypothetical protein